MLEYDDSKVLNLENKTIKNFDFENIKRLYLKNCKIENIKNLNTLKKIEMIDFDNVDIENIKFFKYCNSLKYLQIKNMNKLKSLEGLSYAKNLRELEISKLKNLKDLRFLEKLEHLELLKLSDLEDIDIAILNKELKLNQTLINLELENINKNKFINLSNMIALERLRIRNLIDLEGILLNIFTEDIGFYNLHNLKSIDVKSGIEEDFIEEDEYFFDPNDVGYIFDNINVEEFYFLDKYHSRVGLEFRNMNIIDFLKFGMKFKCDDLTIENSKVKNLSVINTFAPLNYLTLDNLDWDIFNFDGIDLHMTCVEITNMKNLKILNLNVKKIENLRIFNCNKLKFINQEIPLKNNIEKIYVDDKRIRNKDK